MTTLRSRLSYAACAIALSTVAACAAEPPPDEASGEAEAEDELVSDPPGEAAKASMLPAGYESKTAAEKQAILWKLVSAVEYCGEGKADVDFDYATPECLAKLPTGGAGYMLQAFKSFFSLNKTFDRASDELPEGRHKVFHPFGAVATAEVTYDYAPGAADYTGMFAPTKKPIAAIVRLAPGGGSSFVPGIATKYLVDGQPSVNTQAIESVDGQGDDLNWFHAVPTNVLPPPRSLALKVAQGALKIVKREPGHLQLDHLGAITPDGAHVANPRVPYQIVYRPHGDNATRFANEGRADFRVVLRRIPPGTVLYDIHARASEGAPLVKIGEIKTTSHLVASGNGDYQLFFRHFRGTN